MSDCSTLRYLQRCWLPNDLWPIYRITYLWTLMYSLAHSIFVRETLNMHALEIPLVILETKQFAVYHEWSTDRLQEIFAIKTFYHHTLTTDTGISEWHLQWNNLCMYLQRPHVFWYVLIDLIQSSLIVSNCPQIHTQ